MRLSAVGCTDLEKACDIVPTEMTLAIQRRVGVPKYRSGQKDE